MAYVVFAAGYNMDGNTLHSVCPALALAVTTVASSHPDQAEDIRILY